MKRFFVIFALVLNLLTFTSHGQEVIYVATGVAYNPDTNQVVYREAFSALNDSGEVDVDYVDAQGKKFAHKKLVFQGEPFQPGFVLEDFRDNEIISVKFERARLVMRHSDGNGTQQQVIMNSAGLVIDSGLDSYIQLKWDELLKGKSLRFDYAYPAELKVIQMEIEKIDPLHSPLYNKELGSEWIYFRMQSPKKWISIFSDPIHVAYDPNGKYLMRYYGRTLVDDAHGIPQSLRIEYEYY